MQKMKTAIDFERLLSQEGLTPPRNKYDARDRADILALSPELLAERNKMIKRAIRCELLDQQHPDKLMRCLVWKNKEKVLIRRGFYD